MTQTKQVDQALTAALHKYFHFASFRDGQLPVLRAVIAGQDTLAVLPTGAGKTLLYQLPAYLLNEPVLVVSPLISLMQDQVNRLHAHGEKRVVMLSANLTGDSRRVVLRRLGRYHFIFASPEILSNGQVKASLKRIKVGLLVIDEAHCISQWGPDFRPQYLLLKETIGDLNHPPVLMLTATATPKVRGDILAKLGLAGTGVIQVVRSVNRPNIFLATKQFESDHEKEVALVSFVKQLGSSGIIYVSSRRKATEIATILSAQTDLAVAAYHAGIDVLDRYRIQQAFMSDDLDLICATSAFGMGIDKNDIRYVIHYQMPGSLENYVQEIGRAGRNGQQSLALLLSAPGDANIQASLHQIDLPSAAVLEQIKHHQLSPKILGDRKDLVLFYLQHGYSGQDLRAFFDKRERLAKDKIAVMEDYLRATSCRRQFIMNYFGENRLTDPSDKCCDVDQPDWQMSDVVSPQKVQPENGQQDWRARLHEIFHPGSHFANSARHIG